MVHKVKENKVFLQRLAKASRKSRHYMLARATPSQIKTIQEIAHNVVNKVVPLKPCQTRNLIKGRYRKYILETAAKKGGVNVKRDLLVQHGGFLQYIIPAALLYLKKYL